jgi:hypothetical protein
MKAYPERIGYLHLKQVHHDILAEALKNDMPFVEAVPKGVMTEPGFEGVPDFAPIQVTDCVTLQIHRETPYESTSIFGSDRETLTSTACSVLSN